MKTSTPVDLGEAFGASSSESDPPFRPITPLGYSPRLGASSPRAAPPPPPVFTADDFDESRYAMNPEAYARVLPYLQTLVPKTEPKPEKEKRVDEEKPVDRFDNIKDETFKKTVSEVIDTFKGKDGAAKKKDAVKSAAKDFWNANQGKKINYADLKAVLEAVVTT